jgi:signal transduction histidine kinase
VEDHAAQLDPQGRHYLERIETSASQMGQLIEGLLDSSRLQRHELADEPVDMHQLAKRAWEAVAEKSTKVAFDLERLPPSRGDAQLLTQVWINLIGNAVKFSRDAPAPYVKVSASTAAGRSIYAVKDNGAGFDQAHADRLFQPFQRLHRAEDFPGTGIGLALVHRIVLRHGGSITGTGVPHAGAEFRFTLGAP